MRPMVSALQTVLRQTPVGEVFFKQVPGGGSSGSGGRWEVGGTVGWQKVVLVEERFRLSMLPFIHL